MTRQPLRTFGRTKARSLKPRQAALLDALLPRLALPVEGEIDPGVLFSCGAGPGVTTASSLESAPPAPPSQPSAARGEGFVLEIGFGGGEHLVAQAAAHPERSFIGVEPFLNGVASCLRHIEESGVTNVRLHQGDARDVIARLPEASLDLVYILFPDPWPKTRHHKRRLIQPDFVAALARVMKPGAELRFATDWANYAAWTLWHFARDTRFEWTAERAEDWRKPWPDYTPTRYARKSLGDVAPVYLRWRRTAV